MPIYRLLQNMPMGPEEIGRLTTAYEQALHAIGIVDRGDPLAELLARKIIEVAQTGIHEPADISAQAIKEIGIPT
jgi:pyrimidine operon attenuation protein/uracil phosphoribosyltransferase